MIKNLDTGEEIPLSLAEEKLPTGINPLTLHIMRRTKEYVRYDSMLLPFIVFSSSEDSFYELWQSLIWIWN